MATSMTGTHILWRHQAPKQLYMNPPTAEHHGAPEALMHVTADLPSTTIEIATFMFPQQKTSGSFDLFPQHCILPSFTPEQHTQEVYNELFESIQKLKKPAKRKFINRVAKALDILATTPQPTSPTSEGEPNSEGDTNDIVFQRVNESPKVTTSNNPTDPALIKNIEHFCNGVQHPVTGETITKYKKLINIPQMRVVWTTAFGKNSVTLPKAVTRLGRRVLTLSL
eukprot:CCRYP_013224-RA/>CCRYP_013224-RA protein AED:0.47 eAED:0.47 QI:0/0/0/1/0/0/3/0/224